MHQLRMSPLRPFSGWTKIPSSLPGFYFFFHLFSTPKFSPLLPTTSFPPPTYHLPPPSYLPPTSPLLPTTYQPLPPHSIARAPETLSGSELGAWSRLGAGASLELGAAGTGLERERAWSLERLEPDPRRTQVSIFFCVYFVCLFVELRCTRYTALQCSSTNNICFFFFFVLQEKKKKKAMASPSSSSFLCNARSSKE